MKKIVIISVSAVLLLALAVGFLSTAIRFLPAPITVWELEQLEEEYWSIGAISPPSWMGKNGEVGSNFYYGKYNGYYIIYDPYEKQVSNEEKIGDYIFVLGSGRLYALKNGESFKPGDLYANGEITDKDLAKIFEYHKNTFYQFYDDE